jgi:hypothetical protein
MGLVGIERSRRDLQLSFRGRSQITKFRGSKIRVIFREKGFQDFEESSLDLWRWGLYIEG